MNEVVKFPINTPVEVALQSEAGTHVEGRYGEQVMFSLLDNRVMYVPPYVERRFQELAIGAGEPLLLCKQSVKNGNRNRTEWSVRRAPQQPSFPLSNGIDGSDPVVADATPVLQVVESAKDEEIALRNRRETSRAPDRKARAEFRRSRKRRRAAEGQLDCSHGARISSSDQSPAPTTG